MANGRILKLAALAVTITSALALTSLDATAASADTTIPAAPLPASAPAVRTAPPAAQTRCDIRVDDCWIIDGSKNPRYIYGDTHNDDLTGSTTGWTYRAGSLGNGWYWIVTAGELCWNLDTRFVSPGTIALDSCQPNDPDEEWKFIAVGDANNDSFIENAALGAHWAVKCCVTSVGNPSVIGFANGATDGTEYWNWRFSP